MSLKLLSEITKRMSILDKRVARLETLEGSSFTGGGGLVLIERQEVGAAGAHQITFDNIPATFHQLWVIYYAYAAWVPTTTWIHIEMQVNNDVGNNYDWYRATITWDLGSPTKGEGYGVNLAFVGAAQDDLRLDPATGHILFPCYSDTTPAATKYKIWIYDGYLTGWFGSPPVPIHRRNMGGGSWASNAAINRLDFYAAIGTPAAVFEEGTCFSLYGIG